MRRFLILWLKEEKALFSSPIAYVLITVFLLIMGYSFTLALFVSHLTTLVHMFFQMFVLFLLTVPIMTMRLIAEERKLGTLEVLLDLAGDRGADRARQIRRQHEPHRPHAGTVGRLCDRAWRLRQSRLGTDLQRLSRPGAARLQR